ARNGRVDVLRPGVDAADDVEHLGEAARAEAFGGLCAAAAVVAEEGQRQVVRLGQGLFEAAVLEHRIGQCDGGQFALDQRAHVDDGEAAVAYAGRGFGGGKLLDVCIHARS